jgi:hypothetical protein
MNIQPAVLSTKEAWGYVGGRINFESLREAAPELMRPWRKTQSQGKTYYLRENIDAALRAVQLSQSLVS